MRSHKKVLQDGGQSTVFRFLRTRGFKIAGCSVVTTWASSDSIPGPYWKALAEGGFSTLEELASYAESRKAVAGAIKDGLAEGAMSEIMTAAAGICAEGALATRRDADRDRPESVLA